MRCLIASVAIITAVSIGGAPTEAQASWCAVYETGGTNCGFTSYAQCMAAASGNGSFCNEIRDGRSASTATERRERPARVQKEAVTQQPVYGSSVSVNVGFGVGGGSRHGGSHGGGHHGKSLITGTSPTLPPGLQ